MKSRSYVRECAAGGMRHGEIAESLEITGPTLRKYYAHELGVGALQERAQIIRALMSAAKNGNVAAAKVILAASAGFVAPPAKEERAAREPEPVRVEPLGKKEQQKADAVTAQAGTDWDGLLPTPTVQ